MDPKNARGRTTAIPFAMPLGYLFGSVSRMTRDNREERRRSIATAYGRSDHKKPFAIRAKVLAWWHTGDGGS